MKSKTTKEMVQEHAALLLIKQAAKDYLSASNDDKTELGMALEFAIMAHEEIA